MEKVLNLSESKQERYGFRVRGNDGEPLFVPFAAGITDWFALLREMKHLSELGDASQSEEVENKLKCAIENTIRYAYGESGLDVFRKLDEDGQLAVIMHTKLIVVEKSEAMKKKLTENQENTSQT